MHSRFQKNLRSVLIGLVRLLVLALVVVLWTEVRAQDVHTLDQAQLSTLQGSRAVVLPHKLEAGDFVPDGGKVVYRLAVHLDQLPASRLGIYVRKMSLAGRLSLNGRDVGTCELGRLEFVRCLNRPHLFVPPVEYWQLGRNEIALEIYASSRQINGLSAVLVGDAEQLDRDHYGPAYFWIVEMLNIQMWVSLLLGGMALTIAYLLKDTQLYLWVGLSSVTGALAKTAILEIHPWVSIPFFTWSAYAVRIAVIPLVFLAILGFFGQSHWVKRIRAPLLVYTVSAPTVVWWSGLSLKVISLLYVPLLVVGVVLLGAMAKWTYRQPKASHVIVTSVIGVLVLVGVLDWVRISGGSGFDGVFLIPYGHSALSVVFAMVLLGMVAQSLRVSRMQGQALALKVADRSRELQVAQDRISGMERTLLKLTENIPVGTYVLETNAQNEPRFTFVSDRWLRMLNLQREDVLRDPTKGFACVHPDDFDEFMALNLRVFANHETFKWVGRVVVDNEVRWLDVESVPRRLSTGGAAWEGVMIDITDSKASELALQEANGRLTAIEVERSALEERERLLQDMHDGFGSQLSSARIMAEQGALDQRQLRELLQECMSDLYLVVDTLGGSGKTLDVALGDFRFRTDRRTTGLPVRMHWEQKLEQLPALSDRMILQILRILQEAVTNALKHANARNIWVDVVYFPEQHVLRMGVADDGVGMPDKPSQGRGMRNMQQRARELGGSLRFSDRAPGTQVFLELVVSG